jgi:AcrR family transcriptional regulator
MEAANVTTLPRGRHKLGRRQVRDSQRERLTRAILDCVAEQGYAGTTIADVVAAARVSRKAFYDLFEDKEACFLDACDEAATDMLESLYATASEPSWLEALRKGTGVYLRWWQDRPGFAAAYLNELPAAGRRALEQRDRQYLRFQAMFEELAARARREQPGLPPLPPLAARLLVTAITEILAQEVRAGRGEMLTDLEDDLVFHIVKTLVDDATARSV